MRSYSEISKSVGFNRYEACPVVRKEIIYAYKNGEVKIFDHISDAKAYSKNTETTTDPASAAAYDAWYAAQSLLEAQALKVWENELRAEYSYLSDAVFQICYAEAYGRGHHAGADEITAIMESVTDFAENIMKAAVK